MSKRKPEAKETEDKDTGSIPKRPIAHFKYWHVVDSILFLIIVITVTLMMLLSGLAQVPKTEVQDFESTEEHAEQITFAFLSGTIPRISYTDGDGKETVYTGWSVKKLLIEDLRIRQGLGPYQTPANMDSLYSGIESVLSETMSDILGTSYTFSLRVSMQSSTSQEELDSLLLTGQELEVDDESIEPIAESKLKLNIYDPGQRETGEFILVLELDIYKI